MPGASGHATRTCRTVHDHRPRLGQRGCPRARRRSSPSSILDPRSTSTLSRACLLWDGSARPHARGVRGARRGSRMPPRLISACVSQFPPLARPSPYGLPTAKFRPFRTALACGSADADNWRKHQRTVCAPNSFAHEMLSEFFRRCRASSRPISGSDAPGHRGLGFSMRCQRSALERPVALQAPGMHDRRVIARHHASTDAVLRCRSRRRP